MRCVLVLVCVISCIVGVESRGQAAGRLMAWAGEVSARINHSQKKIAKIFAPTTALALLCIGLSCGTPQPPTVTRISSAARHTEVSVASWSDDSQLTLVAMPTSIYAPSEGANALMLFESFNEDPSYASPYPAADLVVIAYDNRVKIILTFDDGPDTRRGAANGTLHVLDVLENLNINAVFFIQSHARSDSGNYFRGMEKTVGIPLVERMHDEGNIVAVHTGMDGKRAHAWANNHARREALGKLGKDLERNKEYIRDRTGAFPLYVRPPFGHYDKAVRVRYTAHDLQMILWDVDSRDTRRGYDRADIKKHLQNKVGEYVAHGSRDLVILFHDIDPDTYSDDNLLAYIRVIEAAIDAQGFAAVFKLSKEEMDEILVDY